MRTTTQTGTNVTSPNAHSLAYSSSHVNRFDCELDDVYITLHDECMTAARAYDKWTEFLLATAWLPTRWDMIDALQTFGATVGVVRTFDWQDEQIGE